MKSKIKNYISTKLNDVFVCDKDCKGCYSYESKESKESMVLVKKKVVSHYVPPDMSAIKMLIDMDSGETDFSNFSDEELLSLKQKLALEVFGSIDNNFIKQVPKD